MEVRKTQGVYELAGDVLRTMSAPYSEDIIEEVFLAIERHTQWRKRYDQLYADLGMNVVNAWTGIYVKQITGMQTIKEVPARRSKLIKDYTKLTH